MRILFCSKYSKLSKNIFEIYFLAEKYKEIEMRIFKIKKALGFLKSTRVSFPNS